MDAGEALRHVVETLPELDEPTALALALVELSGRSRAATAAELSVDRERLAGLLAGGRKALRRSAFPLESSGWCERAERLISDRIDGELEPPGPARLDVHLRNCDRCVEHERRLDLTRDGLIRAYAAAHPAAAPEPAPEREPVQAEPVQAEPLVAEAPPVEPPVQPEQPEQPIEEPAEPEEPEPDEPPSPAPEPEIAPPPAEPVQPVAVPRIEPRAPQPAPEPVAGRAFAARAVWGFMYGLAVVLTVAAVCLTVIGATGTTVT